MYLIKKAKLAYLETGTFSKWLCLLGLLNMILYMNNFTDLPSKSYAFDTSLSLIPHALLEQLQGTIIYKGYFLLMTFLAALMVLGVLEKNPDFMAPYTVMLLLNVVIGGLLFCLTLMARYRDESIFYEFQIYRLAITFVTICFIAMWPRKVREEEPLEEEPLEYEPLEEYSLGEDSFDEGSLDEQSLDEESF